MLGPDGADGINALDLYAGTGAVGIDLIQHGAAHVDFVEIDRRRAAKIRQETDARGLSEKTAIYQSDAIKTLSRLSANSYNIVCADPPYDIDPWEDILTELRNHNLLEPDAWIIAEHATRNKLPDNIAGATAINRKRYGDTSITIYAFTNQPATQKDQQTQR